MVHLLLEGTLVFRYCSPVSSRVLKPRPWRRIRESALGVPWTIRSLFILTGQVEWLLREQITELKWLWCLWGCRCTATPLGSIME